MQWFEGTVPEAIQASKRSKSMFVVYIAGTDTTSEDMNTTWNDPTVCDLMKRGNFVAIKLQANSDACGQFSQIYPVICVPSTFFIGLDGKPLEVTGGVVEVKELTEKISKVLQTELVPSAVSQEQQATPLATPSGTSSMTTETNEDRADRARELLDNKRIEKAEKEKEEEKRKEIERRNQGKSVTGLQKWQGEKEAQERRKEMKKEKEEERLARERTKALIARDREERAAKYQREKEEKQREKERALEAKMAEQRSQEVETERVKNENARIQFRFPDGSSVTHQFSSSDMMQAAKQFVLEHTGGRMREFILQTLYPRRIYTEEDMAETLIDLGLAPSAILIVLPGKKKTNSSDEKPKGDSSSSITDILWIIPSFFLAIWAFISGLLFGSSQQTHQQEPATSPGGTSTSSGDVRPKTALRRRTPNSNVGRLTDSQPDDDKDNAFYNGNSTQQL